MDESHSARVRCEICGKARKLDEALRRARSGGQGAGGAR